MRYLARYALALIAGIFLVVMVLKAVSGFITWVSGAADKKIEAYRQEYISKTKKELEKQAEKK